MRHRILSRSFAAGICAVLTIPALTGCQAGDPPATEAPATGAQAAVGGRPDEATPSAPAAEAVLARSAPAGKFTLTVPAGFQQRTFTTAHPVVRLVPASAGDGADDRDAIVVESLRGTGATPESRFSFYLDRLKKTYPNCTLPTGADHRAEAIAPGFSANYIIYECTSMPFTFVNFTARGPAGLQLAGYEQSTAGDTTSWKAAAGSIVKG